ncbi:hypothetical protein Esi_0057_0075 [Ectocarpus siliculosus]|uniref:Uncharacterized protein n=1 Tax=Ectocarpus siliculosus TaxID=2880 RepID=D7G4K0_ECTSI|nr:hypothetical protein Esi_0057_0075 [Ectocarpus siliculosus]|eukprot:CBJ48903.1 hypothetical protein Esi_0057_0075 [Ectocarpus siliculosus]
MDAFRSPAASPWPAGGGGGVGFRGRQRGASAAAVAAGARSGGGDRSSAWRARTGSGGGGDGGSVDAFCVSPFSPRVSPRALMSSPVGIDGPARDGSFSLSSSPSSQRGAFAGSGRLEGSDWWKGLDLSPDRCGLPRWRESRKPVATASFLPSDDVTENDGGGETVVEMTSVSAAAGFHDGGGGVRGLLSPTRSSSARMSRSYMTLLAAAAAEETTKGRRQQGGGVPGRATGEVSATEQASQPLTVEGRLRQLEAENLRLRFRVADLEGQVSVMEDELDRRGVARPMPADPNSSSNAESCRTGNAGTAVVASADDKSNASACRVKVEATGAAKTVKAAAAAATAATSPKSRGVEGEGGGEAGAGIVNDGPLLSPRGRGYLARLVLEVCSEIEDSKKAATEAKAKGGGASTSTSTVTTTGEGIASRPRSIPHSERLCKVLPKVMETAIRGVKDLDEQVFEQMMRTASERGSGMAMSMSSLSSPAHGGSLPLGTPARRLSSCVVARDGGGEFFAQSPAPGRPASFFRLVGEPKTPARGDGSALRRTSSGSSIKVVRTASAWDATPMIKMFTGGKPGKKAAAAAAAAAATPHKNARETPLRTPRSGGAGGFFGAGDWLAAAFTPRGALAPDPDRAPPRRFFGTPSLPSYLIRSKSKKHGESREASPIKSLFSPGGTERKVEEGGEEDVRHLTKELLDLKSRYMASTQHWLKTDIVNHEELRMIRAQVFEAIQRKRSELHTEAAAVLRAESRLEESLRIQHSGGSNSKSSRGCGDGDSGAGGWGSSAGGGCGRELSLGNGSTSGKDENKAAADAAAAVAALREEEEANRTIAMLAGTAEFLKFSRLLLLLSEAISVSNSVTSTNAAAAAAATDGATSNRRNAGGGGGGGSQSTAQEDLALTKSKMPPPPPVAPGAAGVPEILTAVARARGSGRKRR